jgi:hypothetical protein
MLHKSTLPWQPAAAKSGCAAQAVRLRRLSRNQGAGERAPAMAFARTVGSIRRLGTD